MVDAYITRPVQIPNAIACDFAVKLDSWDGEGRFFGVRNTAWGSPAYYEVEVGKANGALRITQYEATTAGAIESYPIATAPAAASWVHVTLVVILRGPNPIVTVDVGPTHLQTALPATDITAFDVRVGLMSATALTTVLVDDIVCGIY
jgi:hypothetical protein